MRAVRLNAYRSAVAHKPGKTGREKQKHLEDGTAYMGKAQIQLPHFLGPSNQDGIYVIDYDLPNIPGADGMTVTMHVTVNADTLTLTGATNDGASNLIFKA